MKKLYSILFALFVAIFFTSVLGCSKNLREQFTEACQNQDFELAHQILEKYESKDDQKEDALMLLEREGSYLLENNTEADTEKLKVLILESPPDYNAQSRLFTKATIIKNNELIKFLMETQSFRFGSQGVRYFCENGTEEELLNTATFVINEYGDQEEGITYAGVPKFKDIYSQVFTKCLRSGYFSTAKEMIELLETTNHTKLIPIYQQQYNSETKK